MMKNKNVQLKVISQLTVSVVIVTVFLLGSWIQWQQSVTYNEMPSLQSETISLAKFISGVDLTQPSHIFAKEQMMIKEHLQDRSEEAHLSEEDINLIIEEVTEVVPSEVTVLDPLVTTMEASYKSDKRVFIYHTHAREGWHGEDYASDKNANSKEVNITLLGEKLGEELALKGIGTIVSTTDYATAVPGYEWAYSYKYSRKSVKEILAANNDVEMVFDLHRDSQPRQYTTATINGEDYSQVYFIIGKRNENWKTNEAFAEKLHAKIEELYPGLSRGIWGKNANSGNGEYNQSLHEQNVLIEIGGVDNTLEENYRTMKALAEVISIIWEEGKS